MAAHRACTGPRVGHSPPEETRVGTTDEGDGSAHIPPETPASASGEQVTAASGRRARMTSAEVGFTSPDEVPPKRRTAVSLVLATPERRRRRTAVLPDVRHQARKERASIGKDARGDVPRSAHAELDLGADRPDPIALLQGQARTRVPELVPIRYGRMLESEFAFFRGAALVMASDLSRTPVTGIHAQLCGDAHLSNFGLFASPERRVVFDINDFDETLPGPWEWDLKRLAASFEIAGRENGLPARTRRPIVERVVAAYRTAMAGFATHTNLTVWYEQLDAEQFIDDARSRVQRRMRDHVIAPAERSIAKARTRDSMHAFDTLTHLVRGEPRIIADPPLVVPFSDLTEMEDEATWAHRQLQLYRRSLPAERRYLLEQYRFVDLARKVVGVGSVGTRCYIVLMLGIDNRDPLFLQIKEAQPSVLERFLGQSEYVNQGERVVTGQRTIQSSSDIFLGWQRVDEAVDGAPHDYYWRQLRDWKGSVDIDGMHPAMLSGYAGICGWTLARAHARSGDRVAIAAYMGKKPVLDEAIAEFAAAYADLNARDYQALKAAVADGRVIADTAFT
jgi:uncharacterized protein (DUF2252 family)